VTTHDRGAGRAATLGAALGGVALAHCLAYLVAIPAGSQRSVHMAATGHGTFPLFLALASAAAGAALFEVGRRAMRSTKPLDLAATAARLAAVQVPAFAVLELVERRLDVGGTLTDPVVRLGVVLQALVALGAALLLRGVEEAVRSVASRAPRLMRAPGTFPRRGSTISLAPRGVLLASAPRRDPPLPLAA